MAVFSGTGGGILRAGVVVPCPGVVSQNTSSDSLEKVTGRRSTARSSSRVTTGRGLPGDLRKAEDSEWWRRKGLGLRAGLVLDEGSGF